MFVFIFSAINFPLSTVLYLKNLIYVFIFIQFSIFFGFIPMDYLGVGCLISKFYFLVWSPCGQKNIFCVISSILHLSRFVFWFRIERSILLPLSRMFFPCALDPVDCWCWILLPRLLMFCVVLSIAERERLKSNCNCEFVYFSLYFAALVSGAHIWDCCIFLVNWPSVIM